MKDFHAGFLFFNCSFLCLPKETNQRKGSQITWSDCVGLPCTARKGAGDVGKSYPYGVLRRVAYPLFAVLFGCVRWQELVPSFSDFLFERLPAAVGLGFFKKSSIQHQLLCK